MIKHKICDDGKIMLSNDGGVLNHLVLDNPKELIELAKVITLAKFDYCKKFKCSLDKAECS